MQFTAQSVISLLSLNRSNDDPLSSNKLGPVIADHIGKPQPNIIYIQHDSLSGALMSTEHGRAAMPYFQYLKETNKDMYVFDNTRSVSGNTIDALPSLLTGCVPYSPEGIESIKSIPSIASTLYYEGYSTASFSTRALDNSIKNGAWKNLWGPLSSGMEKVSTKLVLSRLHRSARN